MRCDRLRFGRKMPRAGTGKRSRRGDGITITRMDCAVLWSCLFHPQDLWITLGMMHQYMGIGAQEASNF
jgi:hypothetical protein